MLTRLRTVRKAHGLTLQDVADRCEPPTTAQTIGRLETGTRTVSIDWLNRIASALNVEPSELVTLSDRTDLPVLALIGSDGAQAPARPMTISPPAAEAEQMALLVETAQGDYRSGDQLWASRVEPEDFARALNRDVLVPRPVGRFAFGRLIGTENGRVQLLPLTPGARQLVLDPPWLAVVRQLVRGL